MLINNVPDPDDDIIEDAIDTAWNSDSEDDDAGIYESKNNIEGDDGGDDDDIGWEDDEVEIINFE